MVTIARQFKAWLSLNYCHHVFDGNMAGYLGPDPHFCASLASPSTFSPACVGFADSPACRTFFGAFVYFTAVLLTL